MGRVYYELLDENGSALSNPDDMLQTQRMAEDLAKELVLDRGMVTVVRCEEISRVSIKVEAAQV